MEASTGSVFCKEAWCNGTFPARASVATAGLQLTDCSLTLQGGARGRRPGAAGRCPASLHTPCTSTGASTFVPWKSLTMRFGRTGQASRTPQTSTRNIFATSSGWHSQSLFRYLQVKLCTVFQVRRTRPRLCAPGQAKVTSATLSQECWRGNTFTSLRTKVPAISSCDIALCNLSLAFLQLA